MIFLLFKEFIDLFNKSPNNEDFHGMKLNKLKSKYAP